MKGGETGSHYKQLLYNLSSYVHVKTFFLEVERYIHEYPPTPFYPIANSDKKKAPINLQEFPLFFRC